MSGLDIVLDSATFCAKFWSDHLFEPMLTSFTDAYICGNRGTGVKMYDIWINMTFKLTESSFKGWIDTEYNFDWCQSDENILIGCQPTSWIFLGKPNDYLQSIQLLLFLHSIHWHNYMPLDGLSHRLRLDFFKWSFFSLLLIYFTAYTCLLVH